MYPTNFAHSCGRRGCNRRPFMDTDRCFDHQRLDAPRWFIAVWILSALLSLALLAGAAWAVYELVTWVTTK